MRQKMVDWKVIADSYYDKAMSLAILLLLFSFMVFPKFEVKPYEAKQKTIVAEDIPVDIPEDIKPPETNVQPTVKMAVVMDDDFGDDSDELEEIETISETSLDLSEEVAEVSKVLGETDKFVDYEEAPEPIKKINPKYPDFERKAGITGKVMLEVEVFADGSVGAVNVLKGITENMDKAAVDAVKQWEFKPAMANGNPVAVWVRFPITFTF